MRKQRPSWRSARRARVPTAFKRYAAPDRSRPSRLPWLTPCQPSPRRQTIENDFKPFEEKGIRKAQLDMVCAQLRPTHAYSDQVS